VDDLGLDRLTIAGADDGREKQATTGAIPSERVADADVYASSMWTDEQRRAFLKNVVKDKHAYSTEDALKYDCGHVEALVKKMVDKNALDEAAKGRKAFYKEVYRRIVSQERLDEWQGLDSSTPEEQEALRLEIRTLYRDEVDRLFDRDADLAAARNHVNAKHAEYVEHLSHVKNVEARLAVATDAQRRLAATLQTRNNDAFHASVALASAMLKALLGEDRAPRLRVAAGAAPPAWLAKAEALRQDRLLSLFEVALVFDQLVRSAA